MDEKIDILDKRGQPTGEVRWKSEAHRLGLWHRAFHCWISGADDCIGPFLLVQRRAAVKDTWPGYLDVSAAGHLATGEDVMDGLREVEEELGLHPSPGALIPLGRRRIEQEVPGGVDREFHEVFLLLDSTPPERLCLQQEEVESVVRLKLNDAERLCDGESVSAIEWNGESSAVRQIRLEDFVPNSDSYLLRVARAAREVLSGREPGEIFNL